jgi:hypothetical protein
LTRSEPARSTRLNRLSTTLVRTCAQAGMQDTHIERYTQSSTHGQGKEQNDSTKQPSRVWSTKPGKKQRSPCNLSEQRAQPPNPPCRRRPTRPQSSC